MTQAQPEDPWALLRRLRLGREEYCQRLLTMLILDGPYPRWNTRSTPSAEGVAFLRDLDVLSFGTSDVRAGALFVDELELPSRDGVEPGCAPDYAVLTESRLWIIELKTEASSHRADQVPSYFAYALHHYPDHVVDLTYISPPHRGDAPVPPPGSSFRHLTWEEVMPLVHAHWRATRGVQARLVEALAQALDGGGLWQEWRAHRMEDPIGTGVELARRADGDGRQRAVDHAFTSIEEIEAARIELRDRLTAEGSASRPWVWRAATSGGEALTASGVEHGYELRVSRYTQP